MGRDLIYMYVFIIIFHFNNIVIVYLFIGCWLRQGQ